MFNDRCSHFLLSIIWILSFQSVFAADAPATLEQEFSLVESSSETSRLLDLILASPYREHMPLVKVTLSHGRGVWLQDHVFLTCQHVGDFSWTPFNDGIKEEKTLDEVFTPQTTIQQNPSVKEEIRSLGKGLTDPRAVIIVRISVDGPLNHEPQQFIICPYESGCEVLKVSDRVNLYPGDIPSYEGLTLLFADHKPSYSAKILETKLYDLSAPAPNSVGTEIAPLLTTLSLNYLSKHGFVSVDWNLGEQYLYQVGLEDLSNAIYIPNVNVGSGQSGSPVYVGGELIGVVSAVLEEGSFTLPPQDAKLDAFARLPATERPDGRWEFSLEGSLVVVPVMPERLREVMELAVKRMDDP